MPTNAPGGSVAAAPDLVSAYAHCRRIHRRHDPAFYAGSRMLPPAKRPYVDALYAHARVLDEIVDDPGADVRLKTDRLDARVATFEDALRTQEALAAVGYDASTGSA